MTDEEIVEIEEEKRRKLMAILHPFSAMKGIGWSEKDWQKKPHCLITFKEVEQDGKKLNYTQITVKNSYRVKEILKKYGFKWDSKNKVWIYEGIMSQNTFRQFIADITPYMDGIFVDDRIFNKIANTLGLAKRKRAVEERIEIPKVEGVGVETQPPKQEERKEKLFDERNYVIPYIEIARSVERIEREVERAKEDLAKFIKSHLAYVYMREDTLHIIVDRAYNKRKELADMGYKFNPNAKTWEKDIDPKKLQQELNNLKNIGIENIVPIGASFRVAEKMITQEEGKGVEL